MTMAPLNPPGRQKSLDIEATPSHHKHSEIETTDRYIRKVIMMLLWYVFSFGTLMSNKYILSNMNGDAGILGEAQMLCSAIFGAFKMYLPCCLFKNHTHHPDAPRLHFFRNMAILGWMRFATVVCSLISLKYVAVSFTETVKSSAPLFTAIFAWIMLGERSSLGVCLSLIPVMGGLALCTTNELSFNVIGFVAALMNNVMDWHRFIVLASRVLFMPVFYQLVKLFACLAFGVVVLGRKSKHTRYAHNFAANKRLTETNLFLQFVSIWKCLHATSSIQNVFSKKLLTNDKSSYSPPELQFYTSAASIIVQLPFWFFFMDIHVKMQALEQKMIVVLLVNGFLFYMQSLTAYGLMSLISPVTFSVSNTVKRALLIWVSILLFGNQVTPLSALGTLIVTCGVFLYQRAKRQENQEAEQKDTARATQDV